jgi:hypothetical protein
MQFLALPFSLSSFRADDASSVITSVSSVTLSMQFLTVSFSLFLSSRWRYACYHVYFICCSIYAVPHCMFLSLSSFEQMTLRLLSRLFHMLLFLCSSSLSLSLKSSISDYCFRSSIDFLFPPTLFVFLPCFWFFIWLLPRYFVWF